MGVTKFKRKFPDVDTLDWTNDTGSAVAVGDPTPLTLSGTNKIQAAVVTNAYDFSGSVANGSKGVVVTKGNYSFPKASGAQAQGLTAYWDVSAGAVIIDSGVLVDGDYALGKIAIAAASGDSFVEVELNAGPDAFKKYPGDGELAWTNGTGAAVALGDPTPLSIVTTTCVAAVVLKDDGGDTTDVDDGDTGIIAIKGRHTIDKNTSTAFAQGQIVWWDFTNGEATDATAAIGDFVLGVASLAAASAATTVEVELNVGASAFTYTAS